MVAAAAAARAAEEEEEDRGSEAGKVHRSKWREVEGGGKSQELVYLFGRTGSRISQIVSGGSGKGGKLLAIAQYVT